MRWVILLLACNDGGVPPAARDLAPPADLAGPSCAATIDCLRACESLHACQDACMQKIGPGASMYLSALVSCLSAPCNTQGATVPPCDSYAQSSCTMCIAQNCPSQFSDCSSH
jgi:hypothetical protein